MKHEKNPMILFDQKYIHVIIKLVKLTQGKQKDNTGPATLN